MKTTLSLLTDAELTAELSRHARGEREATVALLVHLAEFDARRLHDASGFPSTFQYCRSVLGMSEDAVYNRIEAARALREYPVIVGMLAGGSLSITTVRMLRPHLTAANHAELLEAAKGLGKRDLDHLLARWFPRPDVTASVRKLPVRLAPTAEGAIGHTASRSSQMAAAMLGGDSAESSAGAAEESSSAVLAAAEATVSCGAEARPRALVRPLAPERYEIRCTASKETRDKLREAQDLLGHAVPSGDVAEVLDRALTLLVADLRRKKYGAGRRMASAAAAGATDGKPKGEAAVRFAVWTRDEGRCAFVSRAGHRCPARRLLEFHHVVPRAAGGGYTVENIQLRCRAHNGHEVDLFFGPGVRRTRGDRKIPGRVQGSEHRPSARSGTSFSSAPT